MSNEKTSDFRVTWKINLIGFWLIICLLAMVAGGVAVWYYLTHLFIRNLIILGFSGGLGAVVYCLRSFYKHIGDGDFSIRWTWWYIIRPFLGVVMGVFLYFFISGGVLIVSNNYSSLDGKALMFFSSLAFVAGITFTRFLEKIYSIGAAMFEAKTPLENGTSETKKK